MKRHTSEPLFRPAGIPGSWKWWAGTFQLGKAIYDFAGFCPEWVYDRVTAYGEPPHIRRPGFLALALIEEGIDHDTIELLPANPKQMAALCAIT